MSSENYGILFIWGDVEPQIYWTDSEERRDKKALELRRFHGPEHGIFPIRAKVQGGSEGNNCSECHPYVHIGSYSGRFFDEAEG